MKETMNIKNTIADSDLEALQTDYRGPGFGPRPGCYDRARHAWSRLRPRAADHLVPSRLADRALT